MAVLTVRDESTAGDVAQDFELEFADDHIDVRELIRSRVFQEVKDYNARKLPEFRGLVQPSDAEQTVNGFKLKKKHVVDFEKQFKLACEAFESNGILVLVDDRQMETLDQPIEVKPTTVATFVKLVPLVGG